MRSRSLHPALRGLATGLLVLASGSALAGAMPPWQVSVQDIAPYTPLEIKFGYDSANLRLGAAVLYNDGTENVIDLYNFTVDDTGVTVDDVFSGVATGDVFALGEVCFRNGLFIAPYIDDFDVRALRWDIDQSWNIAIDTSPTNHTNTDCVELDGGGAGITSLDFDIGEIDYFDSFNDGLNWTPRFSYSGGGSIIGPFTGGFRPKSGAVPLPMLPTGLGITYQLSTGPIHSVLLDASDGSVLGGPFDWDQFGSHTPFVGNGFLKETGGLVVPSVGRAFGLANGGEWIGFGVLDLSDGSGDFDLLNPVVTNSLGFQGISLEYSFGPDLTYIHSFSNRHARIALDPVTGAMTFEEIPDYPFADVGGPVDAAMEGDRIFIGAPGLSVTFRGSTPGFQIATFNTDPAVMQGVPLSSGPAGPAVQIPTLGRGGLIALIALIVLVAGLAVRRIA